ncbi:MULTISPECIES: glycosyltransferase family 4 protein [unclassified Acidithiobacillus]|uniref:glycosyltransferase family 4 protein n=1 Tax=unclassified Acidithiobacillus TaxID=2614800 RepID=UPI001879EF3A|nr:MULTISPECIES: glycosyltransferase family 4 protein [unclassified Acidithiobacillus]
MTNKKLVLLISVRADHGGGPRHVELLLKYLSASIGAYVACPDELPYYQRFENLTYGCVFTLPHRRFDFGYAMRLVSFAREQNIALVHAHGKGAGIYARFVSARLSLPCVHTPHGVHVAQYGSMKRRLYRLYENFTARWVDHVLFVSDEECEAAKVEGLWQKIPRSVVVNGVEPIADDVCAGWRDEFRRRLVMKDDQLIVLTLSRFDYQKNMNEAYEVVRMLPDHLFVWIGDGPERDALERRMQADGVENLKFLGKLDDPTPCLAAADIYFSSSRWEGMPLAVLEAMAVGVPVIASDVIGHQELVGETGSGLLYPLGVPLQAAQALRRLSEDKFLRRRLGALGQQVQRERYSAEKMAAAIEVVYQQMLKKRIR